MDLTTPPGGVIVSLTTASLNSVPNHPTHKEIADIGLLKATFCQKISAIYPIIVAKQLENIPSKRTIFSL